MSDKKKPPTPASAPRNWVAKNARRFNRAQTFADRTDYRRKPKHKRGPESWPVAA